MSGKKIIVKGKKNENLFYVVVKLLLFLLFVIIWKVDYVFNEYIFISEGIVK